MHRHPLRLRLLRLLGVRRPLVVLGIPSGEAGLLLTADHPGFLDGPLLGLALRRPFLFAVDAAYARSVFWGPLLTAYATLFGHTFVALSREEPLALRALGRRLEAGGAVCLFPEGAVRRGGPSRAWRPGVAWLARRARLWQHVTLTGTEGGLWGTEPLRLVFSTPRSASALRQAWDQPEDGNGCVPSSRRSKSSTATISSIRS